MIRYGPCEGVVLQFQFSETRGIVEEFVWDISREGIEGEIKEVELWRKRGWNFPREVVVLEVHVADGRKREDIRRKSAREVIGSKAEGSQCIQSPQGIGRYRTIKSNARKPKL